MKKLLILFVLLTSFSVFINLFLVPKSSTKVSINHKTGKRGKKKSK